MSSTTALLLVASGLAVFLYAACGGGAAAPSTATMAVVETPTTAPTSVVVSLATTASAAATTSAAPPSANAAAISPTPATASAGPTTPPPIAPPPPAPPARQYSIAEAQAILTAASLTPPDLPAGWKAMTDTTADNAAAAAADPAHASSIDRCGRLLGRTVANQPADVVQAFLGGETLSFFSNLTVYATSAGATDCSIEAAQRVSQRGELARAFGTLFIDPDAVVVTPVAYPQVADGSLAFDVAGKINASGTLVDLTVLVVAFREGNVTAAVGSARAGANPPTDELAPYVNLVARRIAASQ